MTDKDIVKAFQLCHRCNGVIPCFECPYYSVIDDECLGDNNKDILDLINRQNAEIEKLKKEVLETRRNALLEAVSKFAGHSDYHGDVILSKLQCMAEGKEVDVAIPLDKNKIKSDAIKEFADGLKAKAQNATTWTGIEPVVTISDIEDTAKKMVGDEVV